MYSKNTILFFCLTFYFFQCQGAPSDDQIALIKSMVPELLGQGEITFDSVRNVFSEVAGALPIEQDYPPAILDDLEKIEYSKEDGITNILAYIASTDTTTVNTVNEVVTNLVGQLEVIGAQNIEKIFEELQKKPDLAGPYPGTISGYINEATLKTANNRSFTINEVKTYALAFLASGYDVLMDLVNIVMEANQISNRLDYEKYKNVMEGLKEYIQLDIQVPSYDSFRADILSRKLTVNGVENLIIEKLFP